MEDTGKPSNKKKYKRAIRRAKIADAQAKAYSKSSKDTQTYNQVERSKADAFNKAAKKRYDAAASTPGVNPPPEDVLKNQAARTRVAQERMDSGPVPMGGNKAMMRSAKRNVRRKAMSAPARKSNMRLYK